MESTSGWRLCSICRTGIGFGATYYRCSVSTCNRSRTALFFCSPQCWEAHLPEARHRDAWAEQDRSPTHGEAEAQQAQAQSGERAEAGIGQTREAQPPARRRVVGAPPSGDVPREVLVVVSKLKAYIRARSGMSTSETVNGVLSDHLRRLCDLAIEQARQDGRKTVMDRDLQPYLRRGSG